MNINKTEVMISSKEGRGRLAFRKIRGSDLNQVEGFKCLGSMINQKEGCEVEVESRIKVS